MSIVTKREVASVDDSLNLPYYHDAANDLDYPLVESGAASSFANGEKADIGTTAAALAADVPCREVIVQADPDNDANVLIGNATAQYFVLEAGQSISIPASNVNLIYVKSASGTQAANYIAKV